MVAPIHPFEALDNVAKTNRRAFEILSWLRETRPISGIDDSEFSAILGVFAVAALAGNVAINQDSVRKMTDAVYRTSQEVLDELEAEDA
jgi:hypothetical protein